ncbi:hypothetical protein ACWEK5_13680 [Rhodococcus koreensis]
MRRASRLARRTGCVAALGCVVVSGCGTAADGPAPTTTPTATAGRFVPGAGDRSGLVDIGGGRDIYLECRGSGSPTVVLVAGAGVARDIETNGRNHPGAETPDYPATLAALETMPPLPAMPATVLTSDEPFDYLGIGDADTYWPQWLDAAALLSTALDATHITQTGSGHFIENENPALVVEQICSVIAPATSCPGS